MPRFFSSGERKASNKKNSFDSVTDHQRVISALSRAVKSSRSSDLPPVVLDTSELEIQLPAAPIEPEVVQPEPGFLRAIGSFGLAIQENRDLRARNPRGSRRRN